MSDKTFTLSGITEEQAQGFLYADGRAEIHLTDFQRDQLRSRLEPKIDRMQVLREGWEVPPHFGDYYVVNPDNKINLHSNHTNGRVKNHSINGVFCPCAPTKELAAEIVSVRNGMWKHSDGDSFVKLCTICGIIVDRTTTHPILEFPSEQQAIAYKAKQDTGIVGYEKLFGAKHEQPNAMAELPSVEICDSDDCVEHDFHIKE